MTVPDKGTGQRRQPLRHLLPGQRFLTLELHVRHGRLIRASHIQTRSRTDGRRHGAAAGGCCRAGCPCGYGAQGSPAVPATAVRLPGEPSSEGGIAATRHDVEQPGVSGPAQAKSTSLVTNAAEPVAVAAKTTVSSTPRMATPAGRVGSLMWGCLYSATACLLVAQPTPNAAATCTTACLSYPTRQ